MQVLIRGGEGEEARSDSTSFSSFWSCLGDKLNMSKGSRLYVVCLKTKSHACTYVQSEEEFQEGVTGESFRGVRLRRGREQWRDKNGQKEGAIIFFENRPRDWSCRRVLYTIPLAHWQPVWQRLYYSHPHFYMRK